MFLQTSRETLRGSVGRAYSRAAHLAALRTRCYRAPARHYAETLASSRAAALASATDLGSEIWQASGVPIEGKADARPCPQPRAKQTDAKLQPNNSCQS